MTGLPAPGGLGVEDLVLAHQPEGEGIHQRIGRVAGFKLRLPAHVGHAEAVAVAGDAAHHAFQDGVIAVNDLARNAGSLDNLSEAQRIHHRYRARAHGEDVAQDSAHARGGALEGLNVRGMIVRLNLEGAGPALADVDDARVLSRPLHHQRAARGQPLQVHAR